MSQQSPFLPVGSSRPLGQFDLLIGEWTTTGSHPALPAEAHGSSAFEWLVDGCLLRWRFEWKQPGPPSAISAIGRDDSADSCTVLYADERGVTRLYNTSLEDGVWRMWRDAPGFSQRMIGRFSERGDRLIVHGQLSHDGASWEPDLSVTYTRTTDRGTSGAPRR